MSSGHANEPASRKRKQRPGEEDCPPPPRRLALRDVCGAGGNRLLAGFLANEFLTRAALTDTVASSYAGVALLLTCADGPRIPGVVNPTQLTEWLRM